jgi:two-component sensor histidine kinase
LRLHQRLAQQMLKMIRRSRMPQRDATGKVVGVVNAFHDIPDRKRAQERVELLVREFAHRGKNMLAVIAGHLSLVA